MYTSLSIRNFRAFQSLDIEGLKRVNLFAGRNNSGKTSVLEALYLLEAEQPAARARQLFRNRGLADAGIVHQTALDMPWATLFRNLQRHRCDRWSLCLRLRPSPGVRQL